MLDTFRQAVRILHLDHPLADAPALVGPVPAASPSSEHGRLAVGAPARSSCSMPAPQRDRLAVPQSDRVVIDNGRRSMARAPDYSELWDDEGGADSRRRNHPC